MRGQMFCIIQQPKLQEQTASFPKKNGSIFKSYLQMYSF